MTVKILPLLLAFLKYIKSLITHLQKSEFKALEDHVELTLRVDCRKNSSDKNYWTVNDECKDSGKDWWGRSELWKCV